MIRDPVCGMKVDTEDYSYEYNDKIYHFCSEGCMEKFKSSPETFSQRHLYDLVIIGGGPAGLTAAVYASVLKIDTFLITTNIGGQAIDSTKIKNYMGFDFITGKELVEKFKSQFLHEHFLDHKIDEAIRIEKVNGDFKITMRSGNELLAKSVIVASGMKGRKLKVPGEDRLQRRGISYRSVQDIELFQGLDILVVGGGNSGVQTANDFVRIGCRVTLVSKGELTADAADVIELKKHENVEIMEKHDIVEIQGADRVKGVIIQSLETLEKKKIACRGVFIQIGLSPNTEFCRKLVNLNEKQEIIIQSDCSTNIEGLFACGDVTNAFGKRIVIASGEGAKAALSARKYILNRSESSNN
jgi:alkyl hydroperoxide reductase subunit F